MATMRGALRVVTTSGMLRMRGLALALGLALVLVTCGPGEQPTPTATAKPAATAVPTATPTQAPAAAPTATSIAAPIAIPTATSVATPTPIPAEQPKRGGTLLITSTGYPGSFDAILLSTSLGFYEWNQKLYNNLMANYVDDKIECELCTGWRIENSGKTWVFDMVQGVKFHDGREVTAEDVKYSLEMQMGLIDGLISPRGGLIKEFIDTVEAPSKYVVKINLLLPTTFQNKMLGIGASVVYPKGTVRADLQSKPQGSGPFVLTKAVSGASYTMDRNPNYFKPGLPYLDRVQAEVVASAVTSRALFLTGKKKYFQITEASAQGEIPTYDKMVADGQISKKVSLGACGPQGIWFNPNKAPFTDVNMRKAFNLVADRKALDKVMNGAYGNVSVMGYTPGMAFSTPPEKVWDVFPGGGTGAKKQAEIDEAKKLLAAAGFAGGLTIEMVARGPIDNTGLGASTEPYQQMLKQVGVNATLKLVDTAQKAELQATRNFQFILDLQCQTTFDPVEFIGQYFITGGARNFEGYSNLEIDKLFRQMIQENDFAKKQEIFLKTQNIIAVQDMAFGAFTQSNGARLWWKDLQGMTMGMTDWSGAGGFRFDRVWLRGI